MENKNYSLMEIILGKGKKYLDSRMLAINETRNTCFDIARDFDNIFEDDTKGEEYDTNARTIKHIFIRANEDGELENIWETTITRNQQGTVTEKLLYTDADNYNDLPDDWKAKEE